MALYQGIVTTMVPLGASFGSLLGHPLAKLGRKRSLIYSNIFIATGCGISLILSLPTICIGRFLLGVAAGLFTTLVPLFINEISPLKYSGPLGALRQAIQNVGVLVSYLLGLGVPAHGSEEEKTSNYWRIMFGLPIVFAILQVLLMTTCFAKETPKYLISKGNIREAKNTIKLYFNERRDTEEVVEEFLGSDMVMLRTNEHSEVLEHEVKMKDLCNNTYRRAMWVGCLLSFF